jgi:PDZ domain-containing protein
VGVGPRQRAFVWAIALLALAVALSIVPTPYDLIAPGSAIDLATRIEVEGHPPPLRRFYLTDVSVTRASVLLLLLGGLWPGTRIERRDELMPPGMNMRGYDSLLIDAMRESQSIAAYVAERSAGYPVRRPLERVIVEQVLPDSHAVPALAPGDRILSVNGRAVAVPQDVTRAEEGLRAGDPLAVVLERTGHTLRATIAPYAMPQRPRLGILVRSTIEAPELPVAVHFAFDDVSGSSGGLMFALDIHAVLVHARSAGEAVAGTGTIESDGSVGPVEGVRQKLIAAERAGARVFFVPRANYAQIASERGLRVIPVSTFAEALAALGS